jgi:hypothetical protein
MVIEHDAQRRHDVVEVRQGFAHSHHDHVADRTFGRLLGRQPGGVRRLLQRVGRPPQLADDFRGAEVAVEALPAGGAERALQRAAHLGGNAQGAAAGFRDEHRLDGVAPTDRQQPLARAVGSRGLGDQPRKLDRGVLLQALAQALRQVEVGLAQLVQPAQRLAGAERLLADLQKEVGEALRVQIEQIDRHQRE